jgi:hypothetical protein
MAERLDGDGLSEELIARVEALVEERVRARLDDYVQSAGFRKSMSRVVTRSRLRDRLVVGPPERVVIHPTAKVKSVMLNTSSGRIVIEEFVGIAHDVALLTGVHDVDKFREERFLAVPVQGRDIVVRAGAWIATGATVIGPCEIGEDAVVGAGSVVTRDVPPRTIVSGNPAVPTGTVGPGTARAGRSGGRYRAASRPDQDEHPTPNGDNLEDLLARANETKTPAAARSGLAATTRTGSLVDLIAEGEREGERRWRDERLRREEALGWANLVLGAGAPADERDAMARRRVTNTAVNDAFVSWPDAAGEADLEGPGLGPLSDRDRRVVVVFAHSGVAWALFTALPRAAGRPLFLPLGRAGPKPPTEPNLDRADHRASVAMRATAEQHGVRFVPPGRRIDVMRRLAADGGVPMFPVLALGSVDSALFGRPVRVSSGAAQVALGANASIVVACPHRDGTTARIYLSEPIQPSPDAQVSGLVAAALAQVDQVLGHDPAQIVSQFPAIELAERWQARTRVAAAKQALRDAKQVLSELSGAPESAVRKAQRRVAAAATELAEARELHKPLGDDPAPSTPYRPSGRRADRLTTPS